MKLLALLGYPRADGHTAHMADLFLKGAEAAGAVVRRENLATSGIRPCLGCYRCWTKTPGRCVQNDAMASLLEAFLDTELVLIASPVYAFSVSASVKMFMERTLAILSPGAEADDDGIDRNCWRHPGRGPKRMAGLLVAGKKSPVCYQPTVDALTLYAKEMRMECSGIVVRPESSAMRFPEADPLRMKEILAATERAGAEFIRLNRIPDSTLTAAAAPMLSDLPHFARYSKVFWEHALVIGDENDAAGLAAGADIRILIYEMARSISPVTARDVVANLQFDFPDKGLKYVLAMKNGACTITEGEIENPTLRVCCPASLWSGVIRRTITASQLMSHPELHIEGDRDLFRRLPRYFPPPSK